LVGPGAPLGGGGDRGRAGRADAEPRRTARGAARRRSAPPVPRGPSRRDVGTATPPASPAWSGERRAAHPRPRAGLVDGADPRVRDLPVVLAPRVRGLARTDPPAGELAAHAVEPRLDAGQGDARGTPVDRVLP